MKKTSILLLAALSITVLFIFPGVLGAATTDFTANGNITVTGVTLGSGTVDMLILNGSQAESWSISGGAFVVANPNDNFKVGSSDSSVKTITVTRNGSQVGCAENTTPGTSYLLLGTTGGDYTVTPSITVSCNSGGGAVINTGGTSPSSSPAAPAPTPAPAPTQETPATTKPGTAKPAAPAASTMTTPSMPTTRAVPATTAKMTVSPKDAKYISTLAELRKLASWQVWKDTTTGKLYKIEATTAKAAATIKAKLDTTLKGGATSATPATPAPTATAALKRNLSYGMKNTDVKTLQQFLADQGEDIYPEATINGVFGLTTLRAVRRFQEMYGIAQPGQRGYGNVGPATRAKINEMLGQ